MSIGTGRPCSLTVDTGASGMIVTSRLIDRLGIERDAPEAIETAFGRGDGYHCMLPSVAVGSLRQRRQVPLIESSFAVQLPHLGSGVDGVLPARFFAPWPLAIDYGRKRIGIPNDMER